MTTHRPVPAGSPMRLRGRGHALVGLVVAALTTALASHPAALASRATTGDASPRSSPMTSLLCSSRTVACSVQTSDHLREGAAERVVVTGRANTTVEVQLFKLDVVGSTATAMSPHGPPVAATLNSRGYGSASLPIPPFDVDEEGGWALLSLADATWDGDPGGIVGQIVPIRARVPTLLGDGYGTEKPVGSALDMEITNYVPGARFTVEYLGDDGNWRNVTIRTAERDDEVQPVMVLRYRVPNGLLAKPHRFRAHNATDTSAIDREWTVLPSTDAVPQPRMPLFVAPQLGSDVSTAVASASYSSTDVIVVASVLGGAGLLAALLWPALAIRRRRVDLEAT